MYQGFVLQIRMSIHTKKKHIRVLVSIWCISFGLQIEMSVHSKKIPYTRVHWNVCPCLKENMQVNCVYQFWPALWHTKKKPYVSSYVNDGMSIHTKKKSILIKKRMCTISKKISNDQELIQSDPTSCPQNQKGNNQIHKLTAVYERHSR